MRKYTIDYVRKCFENEDYILLDTVYSGCKYKLNYICPNGHRHNITFSKWLSGQRCYYCNGNVKLTTKYVSKMFSKEGYVLLSEYKNAATKLKYCCNNGHVGFISWNSWRDGHRCSKCAGNCTKTIDEIKREFESEGYILVSDIYINSKSKLKYICPEKHVGYITYRNWVSGHRCLECSGKKRKDICEIRTSVESEGYKLLTDKYNNCDQKMHLICSNGHDYYVSWDNWKHSRSRCPRCKMVGTSEQEQLLMDFFHSNMITVIEHDRKLIFPYELDIVCPDKKIAIEYCGLYWHSELAGKNSKYHLNKLTKLNKIGFNLITIFEDEFVDKYDVVISRLRHIFSVTDSDRKILARKCVIKEVDQGVASVFCDRNHLQKYKNSSIKLGLFYNNELVSLMTFSKRPDHSMYAGIWELSRFCSKVNYAVIGGASKLLNYFERSYEWNEICSYVDRRWYISNFYDKLGFELDSYIKPIYWYLDGGKRIHRFALKKVSKDPMDQTKSKTFKLQKLNKIWDCGQLKYVKRNIRINE